MQFHSETDYAAAKETTEFTELLGYSYTIQSYQNGGIYFTRTVPGDSGLAINSLYYLADTAAEADTWNTILGNNDLTVVSNDTANASAAALFYIDENGKHNYLYVSGDKLMRAVQPSENVEDLTLARNGFTSRKLLYTVGDYLYSYTEDAKNLYRINFTGDEEDYKAILDKAEYKDEQILAIEFNTAWYAPEMFEDVLLYNNAQTVNGNPYNYVNAVSMATKEEGKVGAMTTEELVARNEKYEEVMDYINNEVAGEKKLSEALKVYFRTGSTEAVEAVYEEYGEDVLTENDKKEFDAFVAHTVSARKPVSVTQKPNDYTEKFKDDAGEYYDVESYYFGMLGNNYSDEDKEGLAEDWKKSIYLAASSDSEDESEGLEWWAWLLIAVGGVAVAVGGVFLGIYLKKRSKAAMEERMRNSKSRRKIDTTDDKTIDVYADDEAETPAEEAEAAAPEAVEETAESDEEIAE
jgi:hypothetical protein